MGILHWIHKLSRLLNILSLDVVLGALSMTCLVENILDTNVPWSAYFCLGASVWIIYTLDHIIDAQSIKNKLLMPRHIFHFYASKPLIYIIVILIATIAYTAYFHLPSAILHGGLIAAGLTVIHFVLVRLFGETVSPLVNKELGVGFTYTLGIFTAPFCLHPNFSIEIILVFFQIFGLAMINLVSFSWFEVEEDQQQGQTSVSRNWGKSLTPLLWLLCSITQVLCIINFGFFGYSASSISLHLATCILCLIIVYKKFFKQEELYRIIGDLVFCIPSLFLFFEIK